MADDPSAADRNVEIWKIKKLIKSLEAARGQASLKWHLSPRWVRFGWSRKERWSGTISF